MGDTFTVTGYSHWASHLINGDPSGLSDEDFAELQAWLAFNDVHDHDCLNCSEESYFGTPDGPATLLQGDVVDYTFCRD